MVTADTWKWQACRARGQRRHIAWMLSRGGHGCRQPHSLARSPQEKPFPGYKPVRMSQEAQPTWAAFIENSRFSL